MSRFFQILYTLIGAAVAIGLISAIGSTCVSLDPEYQKGSFAIAGDFQFVWLVTYFVTWFAAIIWGLLFWVLRTKKAWFYPAAIINSTLGCLGRGIPAVLMALGFFSTPRTGLLFTPSWIPAILNLVILIVLLLPTNKDKVRDYINEVTSSSSENVRSQVSQLSPVLLGFGFVMIIQPFVMPTHIIDGVNIASSYGFLLASGLLQFYSGLFFVTLSIITQIFGKLINIAYSSGPLLVES